MSLFTFAILFGNQIKNIYWEIRTYYIGKYIEGQMVCDIIPIVLLQNISEYRDSRKEGVL